MTQVSQMGFVRYFGAALQAGARERRVIATDIANADTPGYKAQGVNFDKALQARLQGANPTPTQYVRGLPTGLDGNDVSLDYESTQAAANATRLRESLTFLKNDTASLITALRPQGNGQGG